MTHSLESLHHSQDCAVAVGVTGDALHPVHESAHALLRINIH